MLRSHLRMRGRWHVGKAAPPAPAVRGSCCAAASTKRCSGTGPCSSSGDVASTGSGRTSWRSRRDLDAMVARLRRGDQGREVGEALLDQRLVAGIGNIWRAEALFCARVSPWRAARATSSDEELERVLVTASRAMRSGRREHIVYRRAGQPCRRCGAPIASAARAKTPERPTGAPPVRQERRPDSA